MNRKIIALFSLLLFIGMMIPQGIAEEEEIQEVSNPFFNYMQFAHVSIKGSGRDFILGQIFVFGFGKASIMRFRLNEDAIVEISKLDASDRIVIEGGQTITLWGYYGYFTNMNQINLNGVAMVAFWL